MMAMLLTGDLTVRNEGSWREKCRLSPARSDDIVAIGWWLRADEEIIDPFGEKASWRRIHRSMSARAANALAKPAHHCAGGRREINGASI